VNPEMVLLPTLQIKNSVKALDKSGEHCLYLWCKFPYLSDAKVKQSIFVGPQIREVMFDENFEMKLNSFEVAAWRSLHHCFKAFWATRRGKLTQNHMKSVTKLSEVKMADVTENSPQLLS
jgi:hypothetical protein